MRKPKLSLSFSGKNKKKEEEEEIIQVYLHDIADQNVGFVLFCFCFGFWFGLVWFGWKSFGRNLPPWLITPPQNSRPDCLMKCGSEPPLKRGRIGSCIVEKDLCSTI